MSISNADRENLRAIGEQRRKALESVKKDTAALRVEVAYLVGRGMTEQAAADLAGVTRMTIRKWLGK